MAFSLFALKQLRSIFRGLAAHINFQLHPILALSVCHLVFQERVPDEGSDVARLSAWQCTSSASKLGVPGCTYFYHFFSSLSLVRALHSCKAYVLLATLFPLLFLSFPRNTAGRRHQRREFAGNSEA